MKQNTSKTSGIHKHYKPGQLITVCGKVFRVCKTTLYSPCFECDGEDSLICDKVVCLEHLPYDCYLKLIKHKG